MKILYELVITEEPGFTATDFPDRFEILRKGKDTFTVKGIIRQQDILSRLYECEAMLKRCEEFRLSIQEELDLGKDINEYFERYTQ